MAQSTTGFRLADVPPLTAALDLDQLTSDGGLRWLAEADRHLELVTVVLVVATSPEKLSRHHRGRAVAVAVHSRAPRREH